MTRNPEREGEVAAAIAGMIADPTGVKAKLQTAAEAERAVIVAWLRDIAPGREASGVFLLVADAIESKQHHGEG